MSRNLTMPLVPVLWRREGMYSPKLVEWHFWLALSGTVIYVFAMWNSGIIQGLMWRTYTESGTLAYSFTDSLVAMHPYYVARTIGGAFFLSGAIIGTFNVIMTIRKVREDTPELDYPTKSEAGEPAVPAAE